MVASLGTRCVVTELDCHECRAFDLQCCFGGDDLRTLYITTSRQNRPAEELAREPWAGQVLHCRVEVPGLPVNFAHV